MSGSKGHDSGPNGYPDQDDGLSHDDLNNDELNDDVDMDHETDQQAQEDLAALLLESEEKIATYYEELLRAKAEMENIRRRSQEEVSKARKFAIESFAESLVPVIDSLEAALAQPDQDASAWQSGVDATMRQLIAAFDRNAMKAVAPAPGDRFDPHVHEAIASIPSDQPEGTVAQVLTKGYTISERVLRPALVMVSSGQGE